MIYPTWGYWYYKCGTPLNHIVRVCGFYGVMVPFAIVFNTLILGLTYYQRFHQNVTFIETTTGLPRWLVQLTLINLITSLYWPLMNKLIHGIYYFGFT